MPTLSQALYSLSQHYDLSLVYELEPIQTERLVELALTCNNPSWRRADIALLDLFIAPIAGSEANHPLLRKSRYEDELKAFIDWLVPESEAS
jgi:hypothetical protein